MVVSAASGHQIPVSADGRRRLIAGMSLPGWLAALGTRAVVDAH